jgi:hypothetical protein
VRARARKVFALTGVYICCSTFGRAIFSWRPNPSGAALLKTFILDGVRAGLTAIRIQYRTCDALTLSRMRIMNTELRPRSLSVHRKQAIKLGH